MLKNEHAFPTFASMIQFSAEDQEILQMVGQQADRSGLVCYVVGGFVRDKILGRLCKDMDFVCVGDALQLAESVAQQIGPNAHVSFFKNFGTANVKFHEYELEFVGARKESYRSESRKPNVSPGAIEDDQHRRDFTINTLAISVNKENFGTLMDTFGGLQDLQDKIIRTPLQPEQTFSDDPLRMMRAIRFANQLNFTIDNNTWNGIKASADRIKIISKERIADELNKIILCKKPSYGFDLLYQSGLLKLFFPQMIALAGAEYIDGKGHKDNFYHTLQVLDNIAQVTDDLWLRWAAILHDIGKPKTKRFEEGHGWTFHGHEVVGARMVPGIFNQLKLPMNEKMKFVQKLVELHLRPISLTKENITDSAIRRLLFDAGDDFEALMMLCEADITSKNAFKVKRYLRNFEMVRQRCKEVEEKDHIRNWQPPITGEVIMQTFGLQPCKKVGDIKNAIKDAMLDGIIPNEYDAAFAYMLNLGSEMNLAPVKE